MELHELPGRYGDAIDDRNWEALRPIFTPDAVFKVPSLGVEMNGLDEIIRYMAEDAPHPAAHLMMNIHVDETPQGVRLYTRVALPVADGSETRLHRVAIGSYYDEVVKTDQGWRIYNRLFSSTRVNRD